LHHLVLLGSTKNSFLKTAAISSQFKKKKKMLELAAATFETLTLRERNNWGTGE